MKSPTRLFVLDTNVLMHDPAALFRFKEHDILLPMTVLEELDKGKKGLSEVARNVRQVSRFIDELMIHCDDIKHGIPLNRLLFSDKPNHSENKDSPTYGRLYFQTEAFDEKLPETLCSETADNTIIAVAQAMQNKYPERNITLVSKDINLRIKATIIGLQTEDYYNDQVLDDLDLLREGYTELPENFWEKHDKEMESWHEEGRTFYRLSGPLMEDIYPGEFLYGKEDDPFQAIVRSKNKRHAIIETIDDYSKKSNAVWGITARNMGQNFALNLLMDPDIDLVTLMGTAGTGKTLLTLAAALAQALDEQRYREIIMTRVTVPVGEDIGFLPGTEEEKMTPWMGALMDNLEVLTQSPEKGSNWGRNTTNEIIMNRIKVRSVNFMRGRTFFNRFIILDEAQNLTPKQMKTLITRAGPGSKIVCLGNTAQIDTPYLTETTSGLTYVVDRFKSWEHSGHITLQQGERSRLADFASANL